MFPNIGLLTASWPGPNNNKKTKHHIVAKENGGENGKGNVLILNEIKHQAFHILFRNMTLTEAAELLLRTARAKGETR